MQESISRFVRLLHLGPEFTVSIINVKKLKCNIQVNRYDTMELYHGSRDDETEKIVNEGLKLPILNNFSNKGHGLYFSSHSRYQYLWLSDRIPVFICDVKYKNGKVKRFRSEVGDVSDAFEFCVTDETLVTPKYLINYQVTGIYKNLKEYKNWGSIYVPHGQFGCDECDPKKIRCDCEQFPSVIKV